MRLLAAGKGGGGGGASADASRKGETSEDENSVFVHETMVWTVGVPLAARLMPTPLPIKSCMKSTGPGGDWQIKCMHACL